MTNAEIVQKLVGYIYPVGESNEDAKRFENLKVMCELVDELVEGIVRVAHDCKDRKEASVKKASDYAMNFIIRELGIKIEG